MQIFITKKGELSMKRITLAIVDDDMVSRSSIKKYLENSDRYEIVMEFID